MKRLAVVVASILLASTSIANPDEPIYKMKMVVKPKERFTNRWAFVVDTSHSIVEKGLFGGILTAYRTATQMPTDQLKFCMYAFNNRGCYKYRKWEDASVEAFDGSVRWLYNPKNQGTMSYGSGAIEAALHQKYDKLTVIIITDGGFTEGGEPIKKVIDKAQDWRKKAGYGPAIICTIGIENHNCWPTYPKPYDVVCQRWLEDIGKKGDGGYFYVFKPTEKKEK